MTAPNESRADAVLRGVRAIPEGYVRTYGDLDPGAPRFPGRVLATHPDAGDVPWHRVVRADGSFAGGERQRERLRAEGVAFRGKRVDLRLARLPLDPGEHLEAD